MAYIVVAYRDRLADDVEWHEWNSTAEAFESRRERASAWGGERVVWKFLTHEDDLQRINWIDAGTTSLRCTHCAPSRHRRRHVHCAGMRMPVPKMTASPGRGVFEYRRAHTRAMDMPPAMPI